MSFTTEQLSFLARFSKSPDGQRVLELMKAKLVEVEKRLRTATGEEIYRQQGRALQLDELISDIVNSPARLNRVSPAPFAPR